MQRKEAEDKVRQAGGAVASGVTTKLHYLVIGDEGSPLYGHGKKGAKQIKAEELNAAGANIKIISETAFLKMLAGQVAGGLGRTPRSPAASGSGQMATAPGPADAPLARFAIKYIRRHHPDIALAETDRPVDPGAEIPAEFLTSSGSSRCSGESRKPLRDFALELARWEFARWSPPAEALVRLAESPHADVRRFVAEALLADDAPEHRRYRIDPETLSPGGGVPLLRVGRRVDARAGHGAHPALAAAPAARGAVPADREPRPLGPGVRDPDALVALPRPRDHRRTGSPRCRPQPTVGAAAKKAAAAGRRAGAPAPPARPEKLPPSPRALWSFLRRILFEIPPARPGEGRGAGRRRAAEAAAGPQGEAGADRGDPRPGPGGRRVRPGRPAAAGGVHDLARPERAGRLPGGRDADPPHPSRACASTAQGVAP